MASRRVSLEEARRVAAECPSPWCGIFRALLETGARFSEIATLTAECVTLTEAGLELRVVPHKLPDGTGWRPKRPASVRTLYVPRNSPLWDDVAKQVSAYPEDSEAHTSEFRPLPGDDRLLFARPGARKPELLRTANRQLARVCARLGVERFSTHQFRRVRIVQALAAGADPNQVRAAVGHRSLLQTLSYLVDVPVRGTLPSLSDGEVDNPAAAQYLGMVRSREWK